AAVPRASSVSPDVASPVASAARVRTPSIASAASKGPRATLGATASYAGDGSRWASALTTAGIVGAAAPVGHRDPDADPRRAPQSKHALHIKKSPMLTNALARGGCSLFETPQALRRTFCDGRGPCPGSRKVSTTHPVYSDDEGHAGRCWV